MTSRYKTYDIQITLDSREVDDGRAFNADIAVDSQILFQMMESESPGTESEIKRLIKKYPAEPMFRNHLTSWYQKQGKSEKARLENRKTLSDFPDYIYAKLNLAFEYLETGQLEKIEPIIGHEHELGAMYPLRKIFHLGEAIGYHQVSIGYLIATRQFSLARNRMDVFASVVAAFSDAYPINLHYLDDDLKFAMIRAGEPVEGLPIPVLPHPLLRELYCNTMRMDPELIRQILALPKAMLLDGLSIIFRNCIERNEVWEQVEPDPRLSNQAMHALYFFTELADESSLPVILEMLSQPEEFLEDWFGDGLTEDCWMMIYAAGKNRMDYLLRFALDPGKYTYATAAVFMAMHHLLLQHPDRRNEVMGWFREFLDAFRNTEAFRNKEGDELAGLCLMELSSMRAVELKEEMKAVYKLCLSKSDDFFGGPDQMLDALHSEPYKTMLNDPIPGIYETYEMVLSDWEYYREGTDLEDIWDIRSGTYPDHDNEDAPDDESDFIFDDEDDLPGTGTFFAPPTPGRNDPCPCGSGKKYKHCCMVN
jgi:hypothetical protein